MPWIPFGITALFFAYMLRLIWRSIQIRRTAEQLYSDIHEFWELHGIFGEPQRMESLVDYISGFRGTVSRDKDFREVVRVLSDINFPEYSELLDDLYAIRRH